MLIHRADALDVASYVEPATVTTVVTSPPYLEQRSYGTHPAELGHEGTLDGYVKALVEIFARVRPLLTADGSLWLNLGDKANGSGGAGGDWRRGGEGVRARPDLGARIFRDPAYLDSTFLDVPGAVLRGLLLDGWRLRAEIIWQRGTPGRPRLERGSYRHLKRPKITHEKILLLAPGPGRIRFTSSLLTEEGTIWTFPPGGTGPAHLAPFPDELPRRCILASTLPGDLVLDPFAGSGTTLRVAEAHGRRAVGLDLYAGLDLVNGQAPANPPPTLDPEPPPEIHP